jgi:hypothetical protein
MAGEINRVKDFWQKYLAAVFREDVPRLGPNGVSAGLSALHELRQVYRFALAQQRT